MKPTDDSDDRLRSSDLQTSNSILHLRERSEQELIQAKDALERKTEELAHSLSMMRATLESTTDAIVATAEAGKVTGFNEKYAEMLGLSDVFFRQLLCRSVDEALHG